MLLPEVSAKDIGKLATIVGILDDKTRMAKGLATSRTEVTHTGPSPEDLRALAKSYANEAVSEALVRDEAIIDVTVEEQAPRALISPLHS